MITRHRLAKGDTYERQSSEINTCLLVGRGSMLLGAQTLQTGTAVEVDSGTILPSLIASEDTELYENSAGQTCYNKAIYAARESIP